MNKVTSAQFNVRVSTARKTSDGAYLVDSRGRMPRGRFKFKFFCSIRSMNSIYSLLPVHSKISYELWDSKKGSFFF